MLAFAGCGDDTTDSDVDDSNANGATAGGATQGDTTAGEDAGGTSQGGDTQGQTTGGVDAGSTTAGGTDAGTTTGGTDAGPAVCDGAQPGNECVGEVQCGKDVKSCDTKSNACCATGSFPNLAFSCNPGAKCSAGSQAVCDGPEECGGKACCVEIPAGNVKCKDSCGIIDTQLCHKDADCPSPKICKPGGTYSFWGVCS